jgi:hypothetical protein
MPRASSSISSDLQRQPGINQPTDGELCGFGMSRPDTNGDDRLLPSTDGWDLRLGGR